MCVWVCFVNQLDDKNFQKVDNRLQKADRKFIQKNMIDIFCRSYERRRFEHRCFERRHFECIPLYVTILEVGIGLIHVVEQLSFSTIPSILAFEFDLIFGSF